MSELNLASSVLALFDGAADTFVVCQGAGELVARRTPAQVRSLLSVYTIAQTDAAYAPISHGHSQGDITGLTSALAAKADLVGGLVPASQLPSYVDDVIEGANLAAFPATGEIGKIYVALDTGRTYRWSGSAYVELTDATAVWGSVSGTLSNQTDLQNALNAKANSTHTHTPSDITGFGEAVDDEVATLLVQGTGISIVYNDAANTLTISSTATGTIGGSTGATDNRVLRSDGTGGATLQNSPVTIDDSGNVSGVGTFTATGTANAGSQVLRVQGSGGGFTRINDNGTVVIDGDVSSGSTPLSVRYNGTEQWGFSFSGVLTGRSGCTLNIGAGQMHLTHSGSTSQINTFGNLAIRPGNLGGGGTSVNVTGELLASTMLCAGPYTVATLPSASANAGKFTHVTDSSVTTNGSNVAGGGSNRVMVFSNGTNWKVIVA